ncbi:MAG: 2-amino-4-hydroxy-6-hydroxymethyldihydropteridine diphosphokinase [Spirochaetales bacterium]|jgi:2-amino-4-hydroxy-6-hydroxymethyldihydropteridine diphosphokinase|nr:2-amino-4-hydroxy-6-hydroxymethyldihydropteridine diphosphokinase [Exilispira sp.]NMC66703.1 2-amino-4-hydroxy-6-hydroxymethyldihydropteridine diphosphokinase [Spirochaetales bacterium]
MKSNIIEILLILGSSKENGDQIIKNASIEISKYFFIKKQTKIVKTSSYQVDYTTFFYNQAIVIESNFSVHSILKRMQKIERSFGQKKKNQFWGDRILDIDIIFVGELLYYDSTINIPHEGIYSRQYIKDFINEIGWKNEKFQ